MNVAPPSEEITSTLAVVVTSLPTRLCPPITATEPLTAQHAWAKRAVTRVRIDSNCSDARSSLHALFTLHRPRRRTHPSRRTRRPAAPAGSSDAPSPPLAMPCTFASAATPRRARQTRRCVPRSLGTRWLYRHASWHVRGGGGVHHDRVYVDVGHVRL